MARKDNKVIATDAMLKLTNIKKDYPLGNDSEPVHALKGITVSFRKNEFVSILGPSGCGKTTLLNIIGGLDKYTDGDLIIDNKSTKDYQDRDWDVYRNHRIGFIFQSYNLIPHQTILGNVELALTISGLSKKERIEKAKKAIDKVGLEGLYNKKPNQLSGGQCQRVAIARALVNEPEILLADEPTGALDTVTSTQIMDLIKEISKEKLVIMVTHNPDIAKEYSSRIIRLLDGLIIEDSNPFEDKVIEEKPLFNQVSEKAKMSWWTAFKLSSKNLISKLKRTILVCIAGSIGIVGVSSVLAVRAGVLNYIASMEDDMLSGFPITIQETTFDLNSLLDTANTVEKIEIVQNAGLVSVNSMVEYVTKQATSKDTYTITNNITQDYIDYVLAMDKESYAAISLGYGMDLSNNIYTNWQYKDVTEKESMSLSAITTMYASVLKNTEFKDYASYIYQLGENFRQAPDNPDYILSQYDLLTGNVAKNEDEIMLVVSPDRQLTDVFLAQLGYYTQEEFINLVFKAANNPNYNPDKEKYDFTYDELVGKEFTYYPNDSIFNKETSDTSPFTYNAYENEITKTDGSMKFKVTGILQAKENISYGCLSTGFYYTKDLTDKMLALNNQSEIAKYMKDNDLDSISSGKYTTIMDVGGTQQTISLDVGITYKYDYYCEGIKNENVTGYVGSESAMASIVSMFKSYMGLDDSNDTHFYTLTLRNVGGNNVANYITIYPKDFNSKDLVTSYLDKWNEEGTIVVNDTILTSDERDNITYDDTLSIVISLINTMINIVTAALIAFTALSLLVSTVMIGIITYVSVVERVKEIGVIRSLGGRKKDVSHLFNAETFIIGLASGIFGIIITLGIQLLLNLILGIKFDVNNIVALQPTDAIIMIMVSIILTLISGLIPSQAAARKNPVEALRTE